LAACSNVLSEIISGVPDDDPFNLEDWQPDEAPLEGIKR
jgi:hypothetical protein